MASLSDRLAETYGQVVEAAAAHERALEAAYEGQLRSAVRQAADRFVRISGLVVAASADWTPPSVADVMQIQVSTARIRKAQAAMLGAISGTLDGAGLTTPAGVGVSFAIVQPIPQKILNQLGARAENLGDAIREPVAAAVARGWAEGASVSTTAGYIRQAAGAVTSSQATMLARTDLIGMSNGANNWAAHMLNDAAQKNGESKPLATKTWFSAGDARVRDTHAEADGQTVPMDQPYTVGGSPLSYPGDPFGPNAEVCNCRCTELYNERQAAPEAVVRDEGQAVEEKITQAATRPSQLVKLPEPTMRRDLMTDDQIAFYDTMDEVAADLDTALPGGISEAAQKRLEPLDGVLPIKSNPDMDALGRYTAMGRSPVQIEVRPGYRDLAEEHSIYNTTMHEYGHYLDHAVLSLETRSVPYMSQVAASGAERGWMSRFVERVAETEQNRGLTEIQHTQKLTLANQRTISGANLKALQRHAGYLTTPQEQWARAFSQWITRKTGSQAENDALTEFIQSEVRVSAERGMKTGRGRDVSYRSMWTDDEFAPIAEAVEGVLRDAGLLGDGLAASGDVFVFPGRLAVLQPGDPGERDLATDVTDVHDPRDDLVLSPSFGASLLRVDHDLDRTPAAARVVPDAGVACTGGDEEASMAVIEQETTDQADAPAGAAWWSDIAYEGLSTGDGRYMVDGSLSWRTPPLTLMGMIETTEGGHLGAQVTGRMDTFEKRTDRITGEKLPQGVHSIRSTGVFDTGEFGTDMERLVGNDFVTGISVDLAITEWGLRDPETGDIVMPEDASESDWEKAFTGEMEFAIIQGEVMAATVCPTPAFADAKIALLASGDGVNRVSKFWRASPEGAAHLGVHEGALMTSLYATAYRNEGMALVASATATARVESPLNPPREVFFRNEPDHLVPLTIDGYEVYGHLAPWNACHVGLINGAWSQCVEPPRSKSGYSHFHASGHVETSDGDIVPIGKLMVSDAGHAPASGTPAQAKRYYDKNGNAAAYVRCVDGKLGIWFSGQLRPGITAEEIAAFRANAQSGDWRGTSPYDLELIAAVTVAIPGYAVPSQIGLAASADGEVFLSAMILTCQIDSPALGASAKGRAAAALMEGGTDALHSMIAD